MTVSGWKRINAVRQFGHHFFQDHPEQTVFPLKSRPVHPPMEHGDLVPEG